MGTRAGRAGADDRLERRPDTALLVEELGEVPRHLPLGAADERDLREPLEDAVRDRACASKRSELGLVLHRAQPLDDAVRRNRFERSLPQDFPARVRDRGRLEADGAGQRLRELPDHIALRLHGLGLLDRARGLDVAEVGVEADAVVLDEQRAVRAVEADEVDDVHRVRHEERLFEPGLEACEAVGHAFSFRYSRPSR